MRRVSLFSACLVAGLAQATAQDSMPEAVTTLQQQLSSEPNSVARWFGDDVELGIDGHKASYPKSQAEFIVRDYFRRYTPTTFTLLRQGAKDTAQRYLIGKYQGGQGPVKVYVLMKHDKGRYLIDMLDLSKE